MTTYVRLEITLPDEHLQALLQHLRDFDIQHDPERRGLVHIAIGIEAANLDAATIQRIFSNIRPPFEDQFIFQGVGKA
jgi:branched-subunit amino acid aminotransferase/4-amino-4-deoxychorismate lyase